MEVITNIWEGNHVAIISISKKVLLTILLLIISRLLSKIVNKLITKASVAIEKFDVTLVPIIAAISSYSVYIICVIIILDIFGVNTASIITVLGATGIAIGLALKDTLSNIASGIILLFVRPFKIGDLIEFGSLTGTVISVGLFATVLEQRDGVFISTPNTNLWGVPIQNYTRNKKRRLDLTVSIAYTDSIDTAYQVLEEIVAEEKRFLHDPPYTIMVSAMGDSSVNIKLLVWAHVDDYWDIKWEQNKNLKEKIEAAGLSIPFPQRDIYIKSEVKQEMQSEKRVVFLSQSVRRRKTTLYQLRKKLISGNSQQPSENNKLKRNLLEPSKKVRHE